MIVTVYEVRVTITFGMCNGVRECGTTHLYTANSARDALEAAKRIAERVVRASAELHADDYVDDSLIPKDMRERGHALGSLRVGRYHIGSVDDAGKIRCEPGEEKIGVTETVRLDWKCDYPGSLDQNIEYAVKRAAADPSHADPRG